MVARKKKRQRAYTVRLNGREIDVIFYAGPEKNRAAREQAVYASLVQHDGYDPRIVVRQA
jgi:hypothetical protein